MTHRRHKQKITVDDNILSNCGPMIPPSMKNDIATMATDEIGSACLSASLGNSVNRLPGARRRLFNDESPENSGDWVGQKLADVFEADRQRGLRKYGFDFSTDTPSTSSDFTYTVVNPSEVPAFYTQVHGCNTLATFSPKKDRSTISLVPISLPSDLKLPSDQSTGITPVTSGVEPKKECSITEIISGVSPKHVDITPLKPKGKKGKKTPADPSISGQQMMLTKYYPKKRSAAIDPIPMEVKKRAAPNTAQGDTSNVIRQ